ncbi:Trk system potassium transporter TrkA [soil metagenome]
MVSVPPGEIARELSHSFCSLGSCILLAFVCMRILIIGGGEIGYALARALAPDHVISVLDHNPAIRERFAGLDVEFSTGSGTSAEALKKAGAEQSDLLVACTGLDEVNLVGCAIAHRFGLPRTICFVSREDFIGDDESASSLREHFGIERVVWPEAQLADEIERVIAAPGAIDAEVFASGRIRLFEYRLQAGSPLLASPLREQPLPRGALIVALMRRDNITIPHGETRLVAGDKIIVMGTPEALKAIQAQIEGATAGSERQMVTIIGGGDVGFRLAQRLEAIGGSDLRIIERDRARAEFLAASLRRALVLNGDGTDLELLESEEIGRSDVLVSVIDNDERNLFASVLGRQLGVRKTITRVGRPANLRLFERVGIDVTLSARGAAVTSVVHQVQGGRANLLAVMEEGQATVVELVVPPGYRARALHELDAPPESIVGAILRGTEVIVPRGQDQVRPLDHLLVFATARSAGSVRDYFAADA